jgi:CubicO group peptidase (beta-lactamase class C family)
MQSPAPNAVQRFGLRYGLGYDIWNLAGDKPLVGHNGQNTGWAAAAWVSPADRSGIVILANHSDGMDAWRWILCDWARWRAGTFWRGLCTERPDFLSEPIGLWQDSPGQDSSQR